MSIDYDVEKVDFGGFHIFRYAPASDDPGIEYLRTSWEARDILDKACDLVDKDTELGSWNRMNAICILRNAQKHLLGINTWEFTFNE